MFQDLRLKFRSIVKQPAFTSMALLTLALGIGATSGVFNLIHGVLLTSPPYQQPNRLVVISSTGTNGRNVEHSRGWAAEQWLDWQKRAKTFTGIAAYSWSFNFLVLRDGSESLEGMAVTPEYFHVTGLRPILGRTFSKSEAGADPKPVILLGYNIWKRRFNSDPSIIGKKIRISRRNTPPEVIGIMPPGVRFLPSPAEEREPNYNPNAQVDFWMPAGVNPKDLKDTGWDVVARLQDGVDVKQAQAELTLTVKDEARSDRNYADIIPHLEPLISELNRDGDRVLWPLFGAALLVLLIACGNTASLMLVRGFQRQGEYALRSALGISRLELLWQASSENLLIALGGGLLGVGLAFAITKVFKLIGGHAIPRLDAVTASWPILVCGLVTALFSAVLATLIPALRATQLDPAEVLKSAGPKTSASRGERKLLRAVAMAQTALTLALLTGAGLLIRSMNNLAQVQLGYNTSHILTMSVTAVQGDMQGFHHVALERVSSLAGVQGAAFAWGVPLTGNNWPDTVEVEGQPPASKRSDRIPIPLRSVTSGYFQLMDMPLSQGRNLRSNDAGQKADVAVVNQALVDRYFPHQTPIGKKVWLGPRDQPPTTIVGVVSNALSDDMTQRPQPEIYLSFWEATPFSKHLVIRTTSDPLSCAAAVQRELRSVDPTVAVENVKTMTEIRNESQASRTFATRLLTGFSLVGSVLTLVGIYGVLSLSVASRRRELAIRTTVGAQRWEIRNLVLGEGLRLVAGGLIAGTAAAFVLSRILQSFLFHVEPNDPVTLIVACLSFLAVALLACWGPSRRAAKVDPIEALRYE